MWATIVNRPEYSVDHYIVNSRTVPTLCTQGPPRPRQAVLGSTVGRGRPTVDTSLSTVLYPSDLK